MNKLIFMMSPILLLAACTTEPQMDTPQVLGTTWIDGDPQIINTGSQSTTQATKVLIGDSNEAASKLSYMDRLAVQLRKELKSTTVKVRQEGTKITLVIPDSVAFGTNQVNVDSKFEPNLAAIAKIIKEYDQTKVQVVGYTDSTEDSVATNKMASLRRANAISNFLRLNGVDINRITVDGLGPQDPIAPNSTPSGRKQNRRVEMTLINMQ